VRSEGTRPRQDATIALSALLSSAGQKITISYMELDALRPDRRAMLRENYFFDIDLGAPTSPPRPLATCHLPGPRRGHGPPVVDGVVVRVYEEPPSPLDTDAEEITAVLGTHLPF